MKKGILIAATTLAFAGSSVVAVVFPVQESAAFTYDVAKWVKISGCSSPGPAILYMDPACNVTNQCYYFDGIVQRPMQGLSCN